MRCPHAGGPAACYATAGSMRSTNSACRGPLGDLRRGGAPSGRGRCVGARQPTRRFSGHRCRLRCGSSRGPRRGGTSSPSAHPRLHARLAEHDSEFLVLGFQLKFPPRPAPLGQPSPPGRPPRTRSSSCAPSPRRHRRGERPPSPTPPRATPAAPLAASPQGTSSKIFAIVIPSHQTQAGHCARNDDTRHQTTEPPPTA